MIEFDIRPTGHPVPDAEREAALASPGFGQVFTDHMITLRWTVERGWHDGRLEPYGPFTFDPATMVFHYAQEFFEGLKAYRQEGGSSPTGRSPSTRPPPCSTTPRSSSRA